MQKKWFIIDLKDICIRGSQQAENDMRLIIQCDLVKSNLNPFPPNRWGRAGHQHVFITAALYISSCSSDLNTRHVILKEMDSTHTSLFVTWRTLSPSSFKSTVKSRIMFKWHDLLEQRGDVNLLTCPSSVLLRFSIFFLIFQVVGALLLLLLL